MSVVGWNQFDIVGVLARCDYLDELAGEVTPLSELTRLQYWQPKPSGDTLTRIRTLQAELGVKETKVYRVEWRPGRFGTVALENPLGQWYRKITADFTVLSEKRVIEDWQDNPIDDVTIHMIPDTAEAVSLRSNRLYRTEKLTLHFNPSQGQPFTSVVILLRQMRFNCLKHLAIKGYNVTKDQLSATFRMLKPFIPTLEKIDG